MELPGRYEFEQKTKNGMVDGLLAGMLWVRGACGSDFTNLLFARFGLALINEPKYTNPKGWSSEGKHNLYRYFCRDDKRKSPATYNGEKISDAVIEELFHGIETQEFTHSDLQFDHIHPRWVRIVKESPFGCRALCLHQPDSLEEWTEYELFPKDKGIYWPARLTLRRATDALQCIRDSEPINYATLTQYLIKHRMAFRTLCQRVPSERKHRQKEISLSYRTGFFDAINEKEVLRYQYDFDQYLKDVHRFSTVSHIRAALMRGGLVSRIADWQFGHSLFCGAPTIHANAVFLIDGEEYVDDEWDDETEYLFCGASGVLTGFGDQSTTCSLWPLESSWASHKNMMFFGGIWSEKAENWFLKKVEQYEKGELSLPCSARIWGKNIGLDCAKIAPLLRNLEVRSEELLKAMWR